MAVGNAARRRRAHRVEVPDHVIELEQEAAIALDRHPIGHCVENDGIGLEVTACFIRADHQIPKKRLHSIILQRLTPLMLGLPSSIVGRLGERGILTASR